MTRWLAFACFVAAAFAWVPPRVDRPGLTALGFAFLALAVGRVLRGPRPALFVPRPRLPEAPMPDVEPVMRDLVERVGEYSGAGGQGSNSRSE